MKKSILILIAAVFTLASCKKLLTEKAHSFLTPDNFYKTADDAMTALNGVFSDMTSQKFYQRTVYIISDLSADEFYPSGITGDRGELYNGNYTASNGEITNWWVNNYILIKNANDVITFVPGINMDTTSRNNIVGNARFLRGLAYFNLVRSYGAVPLLTSAKTDNLFPPRTSQDSIYDQIIEDLSYAETHCYHKDNLPQYGMVSSEAASALLAKVYLQRSSTASAQSTDAQNALQECNKVIAYAKSNPASLSLVKNYGDLFDPDQKSVAAQEVLFNVEFGDPPNATNLTNRMFDPPSQGGYGSFIANDSYYNAYSTADSIRRRVVVGAMDGVFHKISKYHDSGVKAGASGRNNWIVLRYADVLLMQSEAMNDVNAADPGKFDGINQVRARAGLSGALLNMGNTPTKADFVNALVKERLLELGIEGHRRWELIRLGKYQEVEASMGFKIDDNHLLLPIPQSELDLNANLTQNPGY